MSYTNPGAQTVPEGHMPEVFAAEERVAQYVADKLGLDLVSFPRYSIVDRLLVMEGLASAWLEVKTRTYVRTHFQTFRMDTDKLVELRQLATVTDSTTLIAVEWACGSIGTMNVLSRDWRIEGVSAYYPIAKCHPLRRPEASR